MKNEINLELINKNYVQFEISVDRKWPWRFLLFLFSVLGVKNTTLYQSHKVQRSYVINLFLITYLRDLFKSFKKKQSAFSTGN